MIGGGSIAGHPLGGSTDSSSGSQGTTYIRIGEIDSVSAISAGTTCSFYRDDAVNSVGTPLCDLVMPYPHSGIFLVANVSCRSNMPVNASDLVLPCITAPFAAYEFTVADGRYLHPTSARTLNRITTTRKLVRVEV